MKEKFLIEIKGKGFNYAFPYRFDIFTKKKIALKLLLNSSYTIPIARIKEIIDDMNMFVPLIKISGLELWVNGEFKSSINKLDMSANSGEFVIQYK